MDTKQQVKNKAGKVKPASAHERVVLKPQTVFQDLCSTCAEAPTCIHRTMGKPVHSCEEYEMHPGVIQEARPVEPLGVEPVVLRGLCADCTYRKTCSLAMTQGGVWHCEEYE